MIIKNKIKRQPVKFAVLVALIVAIFYLFFIKSNFTGKHENNPENTRELAVFVQDGCYYCTEAERFLNSSKFKNVNIVYYNLKDSISVNKLTKNITKLKIPKENLGTPIFIIDDKYIIGFGKREKDNLISILGNEQD